MELKNYLETIKKAALLSPEADSEPQVIKRNVEYTIGFIMIELGSKINAPCKYGEDKTILAQFRNWLKEQSS